MYWACVARFLQQRGTTGVTSVRSLWELSLCLMKPTPSSSRADLQLTKAKPFSDSVSASGITELTRGKQKQIAARQKELRIHERGNSADTKLSEGGEAGGAPATGAEISCRPW